MTLHNSKPLIETLIETSKSWSGQEINGKVFNPTKGYGLAYVRHVLDISKRGKFLSLTPLEGDKGFGVKKNAPKSTRTSNVSSILIDDQVVYVLNVVEVGARDKRQGTKHAHYVARINKWAASSPKNVQAKALKSFFNNPGEVGKASSALQGKWKSKNLVQVRVAGKSVAQTKPAQEAWYQILVEETAEKKPRMGHDMFTGESVCMLSRHPGVMTFPGGNGHLCSSNQPAFEHYGASGLNGIPLSIENIMAYKGVMNEMNSNPDKYIVQIDKDRVYGWCPEGDIDQGIKALLNPDTAHAKALLDSYRKGSPAPLLEEDIKHFCILVTSQNKSRIAIKDFSTITVKRFQENMLSWFQRQEVQGSRTHSIWGMLKAVLPDDVDVAKRPALYKGMMRAALNGTKVPFALLTTVVAKIYKMKSKRKALQSAQEAVLRLATNDHITGDPVMPKFNPEDPRPAYQLGVLLFCLHSMQFYAHEKEVGNPVGAKSYKQCATMPLNGFTPLIQMAERAWLPKIKRGKKPGIGTMLRKQQDEIFERLGEDPFPKVHTIQNQALFSLGFSLARRHYWTVLPRQKEMSEE